ncbi:hypothetical protein N7457_009053 [Penicillium paradoxum]|uniref:uncharacterized protein n=1 Tax=Penicillium paradoxum TaxID=176176 RepID=UPI002547B2A5|nr:uncharacterized protein N7457_009053 [Penicillium paradoxum]KAJ5774157.1 hypothetical protein N7457_009053 [Penicillium paradoxum]
MKGFIGGIPVALLAVAAQAQFVERQEHGNHPQTGATVIGGPSGNDHGTFASPYSAHVKVNSQVHEYSHDDHSINLNQKHVYGGPRGAKGPHAPGLGHFQKRGAPNGGTAIGGPSGDDEGQSFEMPITGIFNTEVNDFNKDDHSIRIKHKDVHGGPRVPGRGHFQKRGAPHGGTAIGGPSGDDEGQSFEMPITGIFNTEVNDFNKDDHSIRIKHKDVHGRGLAVESFEKRYGPHEGSHTPHGPEDFPNAPHGGTAIGGPSGNDGGQSFSAPITIYTNTGVNTDNQDDHSIDLNHEDVHYRRSENFGRPAGHFEPHPEPHFENHPETHYEPHYSPSYKPHYEPHTSVENHLTDLKNLNNGPSAGSIKFGRRGVPGGHFEPHPEPHFENHPETHYEPHYSPSYKPHYEPHTSVENHLTDLKNLNNGPSAGSIKVGPRGVPGGHFEPHPEPHFENHPESHYAPHYSPTYEPHYKPHHSLHNDLTSIKNSNNGPAVGSIEFGRRGFPARPGHFEPHPEPHFENHPETHYAPHYSPTYEPHYAPHHSVHNDLTSIKDSSNGPAAGSIAFGRRAFAPTRETPGGGDTVIGGPSGDDEGTSFSAPTNIGVTTNVDEENEDDHSIQDNYTHVHPSQAPSDSYEHLSDAHYNSPAAPAGEDVSESHNTPATPAAVHENAKAPTEDHSSGSSSSAFSPQHDSTPSDESADSQCSAETREVVRTVTKTHYRTAEATPVAYKSAPVAEIHGTPVANTPQQSPAVDPRASHGMQVPAEATPMAYKSAPVVNSHGTPVANTPQQSAAVGVDANMRNSESAPASYSMIPVHVPMATPAVSGAVAMATPYNIHGMMMPSGVSPGKFSPSSSAFPSTSPGAMFEGSAARTSGGLASAAAAVMGVLAFIL